MKKILGLFLGLGLVSNLALAQQHELTGDVSGLIGFAKREDLKVFNVGSNLAYDLGVVEDVLQLGVEMGVDYNRYSVAGITASTKQFTFLAGPTINFLDSLPNAAFVSLKAGFGHEAASVGEVAASGMSFESKVEFGKRFEIVSNVTYKPAIGFQLSRYDEHNTYAFYVKFLQLSAVF